MNEISIRRARFEDAAVIHGLLCELENLLGATSKIKRSIENIEEYGFSETPCFEALIAWDGDEAVGLAVFFREFSTWKGVPGVYVQDLIVSPALRGSGLGSKLMEAVFEHSRDWGARYCKLTVHAGNGSAMAFYKHLGFDEAGGEHVLILDDL